MAIDATMPGTVVSAPAVQSSSSTTTTSTTAGIADNFQTFLTLLTTQLQNQNPLDPLDTNQFTQQLVQFAGVEQQLKSNSQLESLVKLQNSAQASQALNFVGATAVVDGKTTELTKGVAAWGINVPKTSTVTVNITNATGQTVFSGDYKMAAGDHQSFVWDGKGSDGTKWPNGKYTISAVGKDADGKSVAVSTEIQGLVDSADLSQTPPMLSIGGQSFTVDQIKKVVLPATLPTTE
ncbi:flagellar basal-body rod modification protein FlgD [Rhodopseudomonas rhenobacensis]|uniref:Basal-body rod modification protein FlgD n=1 Tax=Rhodopseudomonas rhenobacensis TaxID=87461 RepID=A0A7W7Z2I4_9BRAD|nr:flagellar hook capping FlgD N-terminal domain-containing protein [Rhodopseudomonas rhenobacensis]MBB5046838.1 flagellar basal-body rod modification protein FlgD [Rhodopseudomonas rhenobacensis]